jgi:quercetin dioxygenase-like cupin family protein
MSLRRADDSHPVTAPLRVRADFGARAWLNPHDHHWVASPESGVQRVMLDRIGGEQAIATSLVRYAPGSRFAEHSHPGGEEFLVLEGVFEDEYGAYPAGTYVRNPHGSHHRPGSTPGCLLFVKLRQFQAGDDARIVVDTNSLAGPADDVVRVHQLHRFGDEVVALVDAETGAEHRFDATTLPQELLVLEGKVRANGEPLDRLGWLRMPAGDAIELRFEAPSRVFVKTRPIQLGM